jgi:hypothetical protein
MSGHFMIPLLPTAYLPPVSYFGLLVQSQKAFIEIYETYPKQTYRNRCRIYTANGLQSLSIPVKKVNGNHTLTKDIEIDYSLPWQKTHWRSIQSAYNKSPYFFYLQDYFDPYYHKRQKYLVDWNLNLLEPIFKILKIPGTELIRTSDYEPVPTEKDDYRTVFTPKSGNKGNSFFQIPRYIQTFEEKHGFLSDLSIADLLFNEGPSATDY